MSLQNDVYASCGKCHVTSSYYSTLFDSCEIVICARGQSFQGHQPTPWLLTVSVQFEHLTERKLSVLWIISVSTRKLDYEANTSC